MVGGKGGDEGGNVDDDEVGIKDDVGGEDVNENGGGAGGDEGGGEE